MKPLHLDRIPADLTVEEFWDLFGRREHEALDFKRGVPDNLAETIAAMAMTDGGIIVHGVEDRDLNLVGCPLSQNTQDRITRRGVACGVAVRVRAIRVGEHELTITAVPEVADRVIATPDGRLLRRVGGDSQPLTGDAIGRLVRERDQRPTEEEPAPGITPADLDIEAINEALVADDRPSIEGEQDARRAVEDLGGALPGGPILGAGVILFAKRPDHFIPGATVQLVRRAGTGTGPGPSAAREECVGPLSKVLRCCLDFLERHTKSYEAVTGLKREVLPEYPTGAIREAILNALAHRDYGLSGATVDITIRDDRIEFRSPGPLPGHITPDNIRTEHFSRNRRIMRVLKTLRLVEEYGEGVDRMFREMEARLMEPPIFAATSSSVNLTLRNRFQVSVEDQVWLSLLGQVQLTVSERKVLVTTRNENSVTPRRLRRSIPAAEVRDALAGLTARGLLTRVGERGGSRYELSDEIVLRAGTSSIEAQRQKRQRLLDEMDLRGSISTTEGADLLGETVPEVRKLLTEMTRAGLVRATGKTRGRRWSRIQTPPAAAR